MASDDTDLTSDIAESATSPQSATVDNNSIAQHSLPDQIAADRYLKEQQAARSRKQGFRFFNMRPPGAVS